MEQPSTHVAVGRLFHAVCAMLAVMTLSTQSGAQAPPQAAPSTAPAGSDLERARQLSDQAAELYSAGRFAEVAPVGERALQLLERALGPDHPDTLVIVN